MPNAPDPAPVRLPRLLPEDFLAVLADALRHGPATAARFRDPSFAAPRDFGAASCQSLGLDPEPCAAAFLDSFTLAPQELPLSGSDPFRAWAKALATHTGGLPRAVRFRTSGSTGRPVPHDLAYELLVHEAATVAPRFPGAERVVSVMPLHHCFGFMFGVMLPRLRGLPAFSALPLPTEELFALLRPGTLVVGFPSFWDAMVRMRAPMQGILPLSAGAPWRPERMDALLAEGTDGAREIYGASEYGAIGFRCVTEPGLSAETPFTLLEHWREEPNTAPDSRRIARRLPQGGLGPWFPLPDNVRWLAPRVFFPGGRLDKAVQVGGRNVYPARAARHLALHPAVADCRVRLMRPEEGPPQRLKAFIILKQGHGPSPALRKELAAWCGQGLSPLEQPRRFTFGPAIPQSAFGKEADW